MAQENNVPVQTKKDMLHFGLSAVVSLIVLEISINAEIQFFNIASVFCKLLPQWKLALGLFSLFLGLIVFAIFAVIWMPVQTTPVIQRLSTWRNRLGILRIPVAVVALVFPVNFLQYTHWGYQFTGNYLHLIFFLLSAGVVGICIQRSERNLMNFSSFMAGLILAGSTFTLAWAFVQVTDYPLTLTWSEGNRMWDASILFGRDRYIFPTDKPLAASIDFGRQLLWGLPYLIPSVTIFQARFWTTFISTLPYALLGWVALRQTKTNVALWILSGLWMFLYLNQTATYTSLVLSAILVAIAWRSPRWAALPLIAMAGYYAAITRSTWMFAPAMWAGMLAFCEYDTDKETPFAPLPVRFTNAALFVIAGLFGGVILPALTLDQNDFSNVKAAIIITICLLAILGYVGWKRGWHQVLLRRKVLLGVILVFITAGFIAVLLPVLVKNIQAINKQPLLWDRLFPNSTYTPGILLGLLLSVAPLVILLIILAWTRRWYLNRQIISVVLLPMTAFLLVGLIASVKIGGGSNLHNLDMFLIGLVFVAALAWQSGGSKALEKLEHVSVPVKILLLILVTLPLIDPVLEMKPLNLHPEEKISNVIARVQKEVDSAQKEGEVLFMDQRQLLTFRYIKGVKLVPEYEKKFVMDMAMAGDQKYFDQFYADLARHRFSLIISDPLKLEMSEERLADFGFNEENDAWVTWVSNPILQYYEPVETYGKGRRIQILKPRADTQQN